MSEFFAIENVTDRHAHARHDSLSTVTSSVAADLIRQSEINATQNNLNIKGSQTIHIGDVINNIYTPTKGSQRGSLAESDYWLVQNEAEKKSFGFLRNKSFWVGFVASCLIVGLIAWLTIYSLTNINELPEDLPMNFISRDEWLQSERRKLSLPIKRIVVAHTADEPNSCYDSDECKLRVIKIFKKHRQLIDIPYNFLIDGNGRIFEGRGFQFEGEHTANPNGSSYNDIGIGIAFIGTFDDEPPSNDQIEGFHNFIDYYTKKQMIVEDHKIFSQDQLLNLEHPAKALLNVLKSFEKFHSSK